MDTSEQAILVEVDVDRPAVQLSLARVEPGVDVGIGVDGSADGPADGEIQRSERRRSEQSSRLKALQ